MGYALDVEFEELADGLDVGGQNEESRTTPGLAD